MVVLSKPKYDVQVLNSILISDVIAKFDELKRRGCQMVAHCVWHEDHDPSLFLKETGGDNYCKCFACGKKGSVIDYVMQSQGWDFLQACAWLAETFHCGIIEDYGYRPKSFHAKQVSAPKKVEVKPVEYTYIPESFVDDIASSENSFCKCMKQVFEPYLVDHLAEEYRLGVYKFGQYEDDVAFPSIDVEGRIHNIKLQNYCTDIVSPDFFHCAHDHCYWLGSTLSKQGILPMNAVFDNECLFGAHLLNRYAQQTVCLVESPKNVLIGAAAYPEYLWIAAGNKSMLKTSVLSCLRGRKVIVFPDRDAIEEWSQKLAKMQHIACFTISDFCEVNAPADQPKFDIADYILSQRLNCPF